MSFDFKKEYKEFLDYLFSIRDIKYRDFNTKILFTKKETINCKDS